jgi:hypothetical protein
VHIESKAATASAAMFNNTFITAAPAAAGARILPQYNCCQQTIQPMPAQPFSTPLLLVPLLLLLLLLPSTSSLPLLTCKAHWLHPQAPWWGPVH